MTHDSTDMWNTIAKDTIHRYSNRYRAFGYNIRTLGWGTRQQQLYRFKQTLRLANFSGKSILDIGCGFGDYYDFLKESGVSFSQYVGMDITLELVDEARRRHADALDSSFFVSNVLEEDSANSTAEVGVMLGLLNFNLGETINNLEYTKFALTRAYESVNQTLIVDFLSTCLDSEYPREDFVYYHRPQDVLAYALELTPNVTLVHDYSPIPQKEFMVALHRSNI